MSEQRDKVAAVLMPGGYADEGTYAAADEIIVALREGAVERVRLLQDEKITEGYQYRWWIELTQYPDKLGPILDAVLGPEEE